MEVGAFKDAAWHFSALIDHAPEFAEAHYGRAIAFYEMGELGLALYDIQTALALNPRHFVALVGLGSVQEELGHYRSAMAAYKLAFSLNPHLEGVVEAIARVETQVSILH